MEKALLQRMGFEPSVDRAKAQLSWEPPPSRKRSFGGRPLYDRISWTLASRPTRVSFIYSGASVVRTTLDRFPTSKSFIAGKTG